MNFDYVAIQRVKAAQWTGENLSEMQDLLEGVVDSNDRDGVEVYREYIDPYFLRSLGNRGGYYVLKFYAGDDEEVDPGRWVVVYEDGEVEIMDDEQFHKMFRSK